MCTNMSIKVKPHKKVAVVDRKQEQALDAGMFAERNKIRTDAAIGILQRSNLEDFAGRDDFLFNTAVRLKETGILADEATELMYEYLFDVVDWSDDLPPTTIEQKVNRVYADDKHVLGINSLDAAFASFLDGAKPVGAYGFAGLADKEDEILADYNPENDRYIIPGIALKGEITNVFTKANSGKTLVMLSLLCKNSDNLKDLDVIYINLDDSIKGHVQKKQILKRHGIRALSAGVLLKTSAVLHGISEYPPDNAEKTVLIIDTNKKVISQSDKAEIRRAYEILREFVLKGGTVISMAHVNKNKAADGSYQFEGFADNESDVDRSLIMHSLTRQDNGFTELTLKVDKVRAGVENSGYLLHFEYGGTEAGNYEELFYSVKQVNREEANAFNRAQEYQDRLKTDYDWLLAAEGYLLDRPDASRANLVDVMQEVKYAAKSTLHKLIDYYVGKRWDIVEFKKGKQKIAYALIPDRQPLITE